MSYDVYWVKNRAEKIADFEHPTRRGTDTIITKKNSQQQCRACCWLCCLLKKIPFLLEVIEECGDTAERLLVGLLNLDAELNLHLGA